MEQMKRDISETRTDVALLVRTVDANHESLRKTITTMEDLIKNHNNSLYGISGNNGHNTRLKILEEKKNDLKDHEIWDRWLFGTVLGLQFVILLKQFWH